jgi:hypothetical protein
MEKIYYFLLIMEIPSPITEQEVVLSFQKVFYGTRNFQSAWQKGQNTTQKALF